MSLFDKIYIERFQPKGRKKRINFPDSLEAFLRRHKVKVYLNHTPRKEKPHD